LWPSADIEGCPANFGYCGQNGHLASRWVRWRRSQLAETDASDHASAACYRRLEHLGIRGFVNFPIIALTMTALIQFDRNTH
jgi:hypothetical protein